MNVYASRITKARQLAGLTQEQLAEELGVDVQTVKRRENPNAKEPKRGERIAIAHICDVSLAFLEGEEQDPEQATDPLVRRVRDLETRVSELADALAKTTAAGLATRRELQEALDLGRTKGRSAGPSQGQKQGG